MTPPDPEAPQSASPTTVTRARAHAPGCVGNVGVGFDVLGHALADVGDTVTVRIEGEPGVRVSEVTGIDADAIPRDAGSNAAAAAAESLRATMAPALGIVLSLHKGIPLGSGMGGSGASAVAGAAAVNALLSEPLPREALLEHALAGEAAACGSAHADNVAASLLGGLVLVLAEAPRHCVRLPAPPDVHCALVHPALRVETREARQALAEGFELSTVVRQSGHLAGLVAACYRGDLALIRRCLVDVMIEPRRAQLIPGFARAREAAMAAGALGGSISGAGPSVFAWCESSDIARAAAEAMTNAFADAGIEAQSWTQPLEAPGVQVSTTP